jgi:hypothetical protein
MICYGATNSTREFQHGGGVRVFHFCAWPTMETCSVLRWGWYCWRAGILYTACETMRDCEMKLSTRAGVGVLEKDKSGECRSRCDGSVLSISGWVVS